MAADVVKRMLDPFKGLSVDDFDPEKRETLERDFAQLHKYIVPLF